MAAPSPTCELNRRANQLARYLKRPGVRVEETGGHLPGAQPRSDDEVAGNPEGRCAYLPLDTVILRNGSLHAERCGRKSRCWGQHPFSGRQAGIVSIDLENEQKKLPKKAQTILAFLSSLPTLLT